MLRFAKPKMFPKHQLVYPAAEPNWEHVIPEIQLRDGRRSKHPYPFCNNLQAPGAPHENIPENFDVIGFPKFPQPDWVLRPIDSTTRGSSRGAGRWDGHSLRVLFLECRGDRLPDCFISLRRFCCAQSQFSWDEGGFAVKRLFVVLHSRQHFPIPARLSAGFPGVAAEMPGDHGGLWRRPLVGPVDHVAWKRSPAGAVGLREAVCQEEQERCGGCGGHLRGGFSPDHTFRSRRASIRMPV